LATCFEFSREGTTFPHPEKHLDPHLSRNETEVETRPKWSEPSSSPAMAEDWEPSSEPQPTFHAQTALWERA